MNGKTVLILLAAVGAGGMLLCGGLFVAGFWFVTRELVAGGEMPAELETEGVVEGAGLLEKTSLVDDDRLGLVTDLRQIRSSEAVFGVAGTDGALFLDARGTPVSSVAYSETASQVRLVDVEGDGQWEFHDRGGVGWEDTALMDHAGKRLWAYGEFPGVNDAASGDLDQDGILDFVVAMNGNSGVRRLDRSGKSLWSKSDSIVWHVELVDVDGDGKAEIVHSSGLGGITIRDQQGNVLREQETEPYCSEFSLCRWPDREGETHLLVADEGQIWVLDFNGKAVAKFDVPESMDAESVVGTTVRLHEGRPEYFAAVVDLDTWETSVLYVFDKGRRIRFKEVIRDKCTAILAVPREGSAADDFLVGGTGSVWKYTVPDGKVFPGDSEN